MNLKAAIRLMQKSIEIDREYGINKKLNTLSSAMDQLVSNPSQAEFQVSVRDSIVALRSVFDVLNDSLTEADTARLVDLGGELLFAEGLVDELSKIITDNVATPAVARDDIKSMTARRAEILDNFRQVVSIAENRDWESDEYAEHKVELGFTIPRELFRNSLNGLTKELEWINKFLRCISEVEDGSVADVEIGEISTTDPTIFLVTVATVVLAVGRITKWSIGIWKDIEEIRHIRAQTAKLKSFDEDEIETIFGGKIRKEIEAQVTLKSIEMASKVKESGRRNELEIALGKYLEQFLQRIERGMTVEVRLLSHADDPEVASDEPIPVDPTIDALFDIAGELRFPSAAAHPVLQLTGGSATQESPEPQKSRAKRAGAATAE